MFCNTGTICDLLQNKYHVVVDIFHIFRQRSQHNDSGNFCGGRENGPDNVRRPVPEMGTYPGPLFISLSKVPPVIAPGHRHEIHFNGIFIGNEPFWLLHGAIKSREWPSLVIMCTQVGTFFKNRLLLDASKISYQHCAWLWIQKLVLQGYYFSTSAATWWHLSHTKNPQIGKCFLFLFCFQQTKFTSVY